MDNSNRAPMGLYFHATWFKNKKNRRAFRKFLAEMVERPDVYIVSTWEVIQWMQNPTPQSSMNKPATFQKSANCGPANSENIDICTLVKNVPTPIHGSKMNSAWISKHK